MGLDPLSGRSIEHGQLAVERRESLKVTPRNYVMMLRPRHGLNYHLDQGAVVSVSSGSPGRAFVPAQ
jgi:hypothetical protein